MTDAAQIGLPKIGNARKSSFGRARNRVPQLKRLFTEWGPDIRVNEGVLVSELSSGKTIPVKRSFVPFSEVAGL